MTWARKIKNRKGKEKTCIKHLNYWKINEHASLRTILYVNDSFWCFTINKQIRIWSQTVLLKPRTLSYRDLSSWLFTRIEWKILIYSDHLFFSPIQTSSSVIYLTEYTSAEEPSNLIVFVCSLSLLLWRAVSTSSESQYFPFVFCLIADIFRMTLVFALPFFNFAKIGPAHLFSPGYCERRFCLCLESLHRTHVLWHSERVQSLSLYLFTPVDLIVVFL